MENALNLNDGWEDIINQHRRQERVAALQARRREAACDKLLNRAVTCGLGTLSILALFYIGALSGWIAVPAALVLMMISCFALGSAVTLKK